VLMSGADTHHAGGPTHNLSQLGEAAQPAHAAPAASTQGGILQDIIDDLGLPTPLFKAPQDPAAALEALPYAPQSDASPSETSYTRPLDKDDKTGLWVLLGIFLGSWVVAGVAAPSRKKEKKS